MWYTEAMNIPIHIAMTPEQLAAVQAGQGVAHVQDPNTQRVYILIEQGLIEQGFIEQGFIEQGLIEQGLIEQGLAGQGLTEKKQQPTLSENYFREKLAKGVAESERGESKPWNINELKDDLRRRYAAKHPQS